jgi:hypothetical protein
MATGDQFIEVLLIPERPIQPFVVKLTDIINENAELRLNFADVASGIVELLPIAF